MYKAAEAVENAMIKERKRIDVMQQNIGFDNTKKAELIADAEEHAYDKFRRICVRATEISKIIGECKEQKVNNFWYLITINPDKSKWSLNSFVNYIKELICSKYFLRAEYVFEQKGIDMLTIGDNYHCHIVCESKYYSAELLRFLNKNSNAMIQIGKPGRKYLKFESDIEFAKNYIRGDKHNKDKEPAVAMDAIWREKEKIDAIYEKEETGLIKSGVIVQFS